MVELSVDDLEPLLEGAAAEVQPGASGALHIVLDMNVLVSITRPKGGRFDGIWRSWRAGRFDVLLP